MPHWCAVRMTSCHCIGDEFVARENVADFIIENFGGSAGQRIEAVIAQHAQVITQRHAGEFDTVDDLHGREGVDVHTAGQRSLRRAECHGNRKEDRSWGARLECRPQLRRAPTLRWPFGPCHERMEIGVWLRAGRG